MKRLRLALFRGTLDLEPWPNVNVLSRVSKKKTARKVLEELFVEDIMGLMGVIRKNKFLGTA